jgi:hypothetical protein
MNISVASRNCSILQTGGGILFTLKENATNNRYSKNSAANPKLHVEQQCHRTSGRVKVIQSCVYRLIRIVVISTIWIRAVAVIAVDPVENGGELYDTLMNNTLNEGGYIELDTKTLDVMVYAPPLELGEGVELTEISYEGRKKLIHLHMNASVTEGANKSRLLDTPSCIFIVTADCVSLTTGLTYTTRCCNGAKSDSACTSWYHGSAKTIELKQSSSTIATAWCASGITRGLTVGIFKNGRKVTHSYHLIVLRTRQNYGYAISCS